MNSRRVSLGNCFAISFSAANKIFAEVVTSHLGVADTRTIFPGFKDAQRLGFLSV